MGNGLNFDVRGVALFKGMNGCDIAGLLAVAQHKTIARGCVFFREDDPASHCHLLISGHAKLVQGSAEGSQVVLRFVGPGEMFGWASILGGSVYPATAEAMADSTALVWDGDAIERAVLEKPVFARNAMAILGSRLREAQDRLRELATERVERRLGRALLRLSDQLGRPIAEGIEIPFPVTREVLAETTGATLHTVSRVLASWDQRGWVGGSRTRLVILQPDLIRALVDE